MSGQDLSGTVLDGRYKVIEPIAEGAMGSVYRGERLKLGRAVAIKIMHDALPDELSSRQRFEREAKLMARIEHPHCVSVMDFGLHEERPFLVMELVRGTSLLELLEKDVRIDPARAVDLVRQILSGLGHAHELGIVHRDIKPANIMLTQKTGLGEQARILDFGLARPAVSESTKLTTGIVVGTPNYMAPEQIKGTDVDGRTDLYACGVMLFEMLTGRKPFLADDPIQVVRKHLNEPPPTLSEAMPGNDFGELESIVARALAKAPDDRFGTAAEMSSALERAIDKLGARKVAELMANAVPHHGAISPGAQVATMSGWNLPMSDAFAPGSSAIPTAAAHPGSAPVPGVMGQMPSGPNAMGQMPSGPNAMGQMPSGPNAMPNGMGPMPSGPNAGPMPSGPNAMGMSGPNAMGMSGPGPMPSGPNVGPMPSGPNAMGMSGPNAMGQMPSPYVPNAMAIPASGPNAIPASGPNAMPASGPNAMIPEGADTIPDGPVRGSTGPVTAMPSGPASRMPTGPVSGLASVPDTIVSGPVSGAMSLPRPGSSGVGTTSDSQVQTRIALDAVPRARTGIRWGERPFAQVPLTLRQLAIGGGALLLLIIVVAATRGGGGASANKPSDVVVVQARDAGMDDVVAPALARASDLYANGDLDTALDVALKARRQRPDNAQLAFMAGKIYFARLYWTDGIKNFRDAIRLDPAYRSDPELMKIALRGFNTTPDTDSRLEEFVREDIGAAIVPLLEDTAENHPNSVVRGRAAAELRRIH